jgi:hypothetical protein
MNDKVQHYIGYPANYIGFVCPGCRNSHILPTNIGDEVPGKWGYNGNPKKPTFTPSILLREYEANKIKDVCHSYVFNGQIQFLKDSTHHLSGQTVSLDDI